MVQELLQLQRHVVNARRSIVLTTHASAPPPYSHVNGLVENAIGRIRPLAGSLMRHMSEQVGVDFSSNSPWWSWALRHAAWLIKPAKNDRRPQNPQPDLRFTGINGETPKEKGQGPNCSCNCEAKSIMGTKS